MNRMSELDPVAFQKVAGMCDCEHCRPYSLTEVFEILIARAGDRQVQGELDERGVEWRREGQR